MKKVLALAAVAASVALVVVGAALADHSWNGYHWERSANPLQLSVGDNVDSRWDTYLNEAIVDWTRSSVIDLSNDPGGTSPKSCRPTSGRIEACNASYGNTGWLGIAQIWVSGSHITQAITKVNDSYFDTATYNTPAWRQLVMCQEIAHDFGLDHQDETYDNPNLGSCMDYTNDPDGGAGGASSNDPTNERPNAHDFEQLEAIYAHLDTGGGGGTPGCPGPAPKCQSGAGNPPTFSQADRANGSVYLDALPGGATRITHVFWTPFGE